MKGKRKCDSSIKKELSKDVSIRKNAPKERRNKDFTMSKEELKESRLKSSGKKNK